jgi:hypothetical protein
MRRLPLERFMMGTRHHSADAVGELASSQLLPFFSPATQLITKIKEDTASSEKNSHICGKQRNAWHGSDQRRLRDSIVPLFSVSTGVDIKETT